MKIAFDGRAAQRPAHSYRRVLELVVAAAEEVAAGVEMWVDGELHAECATYRSYARAFPRNGERTDADVVWTPTPSVLDGAGAPTVSTVCDVNPLLPDGRPAILRWRRGHRFRCRVTQAAASSWRVATDSQDACRRLAHEFPDYSNKLRVIPLFAHPSLRRLPDSQRDELLGELGLKAGYIYFVGSFRRHKNWHGLMRAYAMFPAKLRADHPLVFAGPVHRDMRRAERLMGELGIQDTVRILDQTPERLMVALYSGAELFVFPSFMEGFGLPALEAMQCGVPVIASNRTAVPEVLGGAARYVDPADLVGIAGAMQEVLASRAVREAMVDSGLERAAQFGPRRTGDAMLALLAEGRVSE